FSGTNQGVGTSSLFIAQNRNVGVGTTSPFAKLSVQANNGDTNSTVFAVASSTSGATTTLFSVSNTGAVSAASGNFTIPAIGGFTTDHASLDTFGDLTLTTGSIFITNNTFLGFGGGAGINRTVNTGVWGWVPSTNVQVQPDTALSRLSANTIGAGNGTS